MTEPLPDRLSPDQDDFYHALMDAHEGLSEAQSHALNARLVLLLANEVGDVARLHHLLSVGRGYADG
jgi:hypothetical protein